MAKKTYCFLKFSLFLLIVMLGVTDSNAKVMASLDPIFVETEIVQTIEEETSENCDFSHEPLKTEIAPIPLTQIQIENTLITLQVTGSTVFTREEIVNFEDIRLLLQSLEGKTLSQEQFKIAYQSLVDSITQLYLTKGYITSKAIPLNTFSEEQEIVEIPIIEGNLEQIQIIKRGKLRLAYLCSRIALGVDVPFNIISLEEQLRLLNLNPLIENVTANLKASGKPGLSILAVEVEEARSLTVNFGIDNYSPPTLGSERWNVGVNYGNVTGWGDEISLTYYRSFTGGSNIVDFTYRVPLNPQEGTLQLRIVPNWTEITQPPFDQFDIRGENQNYEISYRQPLIRTLREEFALSWGFRYAQGQTFGLNRPDLFGSTRTSVIQFSQDYLRRDAGGVWFGRSLFNFGTGLFDPTTNSDFLPDGYFFSWLGQVQRLQRLGNDHLLIIQGEIQLTTDPLVPDYLFIIGGGQSLRGYRQNVRSGDNGFRISIEDRITVLRRETGVPQLQIAPFLDLGQVWNSANNPTTLPSQTFLLGIGLGIIWEPTENLSLRLDYGYPVIDLQDRGNNLQDDGLYFEIRSYFN